MNESSEVGGAYTVAVAQLDLEGYSRITYKYTADDVAALMVAARGDKTLFYRLWKRYHHTKYAGFVQAFAAAYRRRPWGLGGGPGTLPGHRRIHPGMTELQAWR